MLYGRRKLLDETEKAEARGDILWTDKLKKRTRNRLYHQVEALSTHLGETDIVSEAWFLTVQDIGVSPEADQIIGPRQAAMRAILSADESVVLSFIEALILVSKRLRQPAKILDRPTDFLALHKRIPVFLSNVQTILLEHRVSFDLVDGRFAPFESREMHENVVVPTLTLLGGRQDLADVEKAYHEALDQIHSGQASSAITKVATALQEALVTLGCEGKNLGRLLASARKKGLVSSHDEQLINWVSADRNNKGDAHNASSASIEDAWLTVYVVGALILRIVGGPLRGVQAS